MRLGGRALARDPSDSALERCELDRFIVGLLVGAGTVPLPAGKLCFAPVDAAEPFAAGVAERGAGAVAPLDIRAEPGALASSICGLTCDLGALGTSGMTGGVFMSTRDMMLRPSAACRVSSLARAIAPVVLDPTEPAGTPDLRRTEPVAVLADRAVAFDAVDFIVLLRLSEPDAAGKRVWPMAKRRAESRFRCPA